jgi:hypothetical protein
MNDSDHDPDPRRRVPTVLWLILGLALIVVFAAVVGVLGGHIGLRALGPPPGAP